MNRKLTTLIVLLIFCLNIFAQLPNATSYRSNQIDTFFGVSIADPYRWMENDTSQILSSWLESQKQLSKKVYKSFADVSLSYLYLNMVGKRYTKNLTKLGQYYFGFLRKDEKSVPLLEIYKSEKRENGTTIFDPSSLKKYNSEEIQVIDLKLSVNQRYLGITFSSSGTDWKEIVVYDLKERKLLEDIVRGIRFDIRWGNQGFYYHTLHDNVDVLFYHTLGTNQQNDELIQSFDQSKLLDYQYIPSKNRLIITESSWLKEFRMISIYYKSDEDSTKHIIAALKSKKSFLLDFIGIINDSMVLHTNFKSSRGKVIKCGFNQLNGFAEFIPEYKEVISDLVIADNKLLCMYSTKGKNFSILYNDQGDILHKKDYSPGCFVELNEPEPNDSTIIYDEGSYFYTPVSFKYNLRNFTTQFIDKKVEVTYDHRFFTTKYIEYPSKDGTMIPMFITYHQDVKKNGKNPVMVYGYGGFGVSAQPFFDPATILFLNNNGILAHPAIRGGGDLGAEWHEAGKNLNKQVSFDDFIAAAEYMIKENYTTKDLLIASGASNGGMLVTSVMVQRPDLFKVVVAEAPVTDMLRFKHYTSGQYWLGEYGSTQDSVECLNLLSYSPIHNIKKDIQYPATLVITGNHDDRVVPFHSYKLIATLQHNNPSVDYVLYTQSETGHNGSNVADKSVLKASYKWLFIFNKLNIKPRFENY